MKNHVLAKYPYLQRSMPFSPLGQLCIVNLNCRSYFSLLNTLHRTWFSYVATCLLYKILVVQHVCCLTLSVCATSLLCIMYIVQYACRATCMLCNVPTCHATFLLCNIPIVQECATFLLTISVALFLFMMWSSHSSQSSLVREKD